MKTNTMLISCAAILSLSVLFPAPLFSAPPNPAVAYPAQYDVSPPLSGGHPTSRTLPPASEGTAIPTFPLIGSEDSSRLLTKARTAKEDPAVQDRPSPLSMPDPELSFEGIANVNRAYPPDPQGDVGPNHYVQVVNLSFAVWDKSGALLYGPADLNSLWEGFGGPCEHLNDGDPIVLYDHLADRWLLSRFALPNGKYDGPYYQCIAVSRTPDPTGAWHRYAYLTSYTKFNDYPKFGVWPDGYYMSVNQFESGGFAGAGAAAFEREKMIQGLDARMIYFDLAEQDPRLGGMLPSDLDGPPPPSGAPNYFLQFDDDAWDYPRDQLELWTFETDWSAPENARFEKIAHPPVAPFDSELCGYRRDCIPQPDTEAGVDAISDRLMFRLQYRNFGDRQSMVANHTVDADGTDHAGIRWYELGNDGGGWTLRQQGTFAPDDRHRWMGSIAMDRNGNIALGYSLSGETTYPSLACAGRLAADPPNLLAQGETVLTAGGGSQVDRHHRWGDYSMMSVDPVDGCTFWYTGEYYAQSQPGQWRTRIGAFRFPSCADGPAGELGGRVTDVMGNPISGAWIETEAAATLTDETGAYRFAHLPAGDHSLTATAYGHVSRTSPTTIETGLASRRDFVLTPFQSRIVEGRVTDAVAGWPLYAEITFSTEGFTRTLFTDPVTGQYRTELYAGVEYDLEVRALIPGYAPLSLTFTPGDGADVSLNADAGCTAPGYGFFLETFDICGPTARWTRMDYAGSGILWRLNAQGEDGNRTGGTGCAAVSDISDQDVAEIDAALISPLIDCSRLDGAILSFRHHYGTRTGEDAADVDVSPDGGITWVTVWQSPDAGEEGPRTVTVDVTDEAAGRDRVRVRFRHHNAFRQGTWQIDDVALSGGPGTCFPPPSGGLAVGHVHDRDAGVPVNGAVVASDAGGSATTIATPDDPGVDDGFFALYVPSGPHRLRAGKGVFLPDVRTVAAPEGGAVSLDFQLGASNLVADPAALTIEAQPGGGATASLALGNAGSIYAEFAIAVSSPGGWKPDWISVSPSTGFIPAGESETIEVSLDAPRGDVGDRFEAIIQIHDLMSPVPIRVPIELVIAEQADIDRSFPEDDAAITEQDSAVVIDVLANDRLSDPDNPVIELASTPAHGKAELEETRIRYTPEPGFIGTDRFAYALDGVRADVAVQIWKYAAGRREETGGDIPDGRHPGLASTIGITGPEDAATEGVRVRMTLRHSFLSDLSAWLISPDGTRILLFENLSGADMVETAWDDLSPFHAASAAAPYSGSFRPAESLTALDGRPISGEWTLEIVDHAQLDAGRLVAWELDIFYSNATRIAVDHTADGFAEDGRCTLREAIQAASADAAVGGCAAGGRRDIISLPAGIYELTLEGTDENLNQSGDLDIRAKGSVTIQGAGDGGTVLETRLNDRLIHVHSGGDVALSHLTLRGGFIDPERISLVGGGGILNQNAALRIDHCTISGNEAGLGGGVHNDRGRLTILSSRIAANVGQNGGGVLDTFGRTEIRDSEISENRAAIEGGGIDCLSGDLVIHGAAIWGNSARESGGGIYNQYGDIRLSAATLSKNRAMDGGGLFNNGGAARLDFVTVAGNDAIGNGGGLSNPDGGTLEMGRSLVAGNIVQVKSETADISGRIVSLGGNLIGNSAGGRGYRNNQDFLDVDPLTTPLAVQGGPTRTHGLQPRSPAVDAIDCDRFGTDQRGAHRPVNGRCDIGAFEHDHAPYPPVAEDDRVVSSGNPVHVDVLANDGDPNGDPLTVSIGTPPANGALQSDGDGYVYTPNQGFIGEDAFRYVVSDGDHADAATVKIVVEANTPPSLRDDGVAAPRDGWVVIDVLENDSDRDGDRLSLLSSSAPEHGSAFIADNRIYYFPDPGFMGRDAFAYRAGDGVDTAEATVVVTMWENDGVIPVDHLADDAATDGRCSIREALQAAALKAPVDACPAGGLQSVIQLPPGLFKLNALSSEDDAPGGDLDITTGRIILRGDPDGSTVLESAPGHRTLHVHPGAEAEIRSLTLQGSAGDDALEVDGGILNEGFLRATAVTLTRNRGDWGGAIHNAGDLVLQNVTLSGNTAGKGGGLYNEGRAALSFTTIASNHAIYDGGGLHTLAGWSELRNTLVAGNTAGRNGADLRGYAQSRGGNLFGAIEETSADAYAETDLLNVDAMLVPLADNGGAGDTHALRIDSPAVDAVDCVGVGGSRVYVDQRSADRPQGNACDIGAFEHDGAYYPPAARDDRAAVQNDRRVIIPVLANDGSASGLPLFVARISPPAHGTALDNLDGTILYTPDPGFVGTDLFDYAVSDRRAVDTARVTVTVSPNLPPEAGDDAAETFQGEPVIVQVLENDADPDGYALFVTDVGPPSHGTAVTDGAIIVYTPNPGFSGMDAFTYHASDGAQTAKGRVSVAVAGLGLEDVLAALKIPAGIDVPSERLTRLLRFTERIDLATAIRLLRNLAQ